MRQNKFLKYFGKWWIPFSFWGITFILFNIGELWKISLLKQFSFEIMSIALVVLLVSTIYQFYKREWFGAIISILAIGGTFIFFIVVALAMFFVNTVDGDKWADNLKIPNNIPISNPINLPTNGIRPDSIKNIKRVTSDFQLYNSFQPGLYYYDFWTSRIANGIIYLKAFEITQNYNLSKDRLPQTTAIMISNPTNDIVKFGTVSDFTIYEGDWGKPYAARFEVWFKPQNGGQEIKLFERNYKIEGWMR